MRGAPAILIALVLPLLAGAAGAETFTSVQSGNWGEPATWGHEWAYPESDDPVICLHHVNVEDGHACDSLTVAESAFVFTSYGYRDLHIQSHALVDGVVFSEEGGWPLTVHLFGDLVLNGEIACHRWSFLGASEQRLAMASGARFAPRYLDLHESGRLVAQTDVRLATPQFDLDGGTFALAPGCEVAFEGCRVQDGTIEAEGGTLRFEAGAYVGSVTLSEPVLAGTVRIYGPVQCTAGTVVADSVVSHYGLGTLTVDDIVNQGLIANGDAALEVRVLGDAVNHGVWEGHELILGGLDAAHTLAQAPGTRFAPEYLRFEAGTGPVTIEGTVEMATIADLDGGTVILSSDAALVLSGGHIDDASFVGNRGILELHDGAWIGGSVLSDIALRGDVLLSNGTVFTGRTWIEGALDNRPNVTTSFENVDNAGEVGLNSGQFVLSVSGDLNNRGVWDVTRTRISGAEDQFIGASDEHPVGAELRLESNLGGTGHVWSRDGVVQPELTGPTLTFSPARTEHHGVWQCHSSAGDSRHITIGEPQNPAGLGDPPAHRELLGNRPNPFYTGTDIVFGLAAPGKVRLEVFDALGRLVGRLVDGRRPAGVHLVRWDAGDLPAGVYLYRLTANGEQRTGRCVLVR
ncbi:MAG: T9SS type A sorting domain-containing protein [Candidatus Latescibacteria bacterium]|nr:T9SS type A sorting domain-containing protein [Candidatus Latescibacterota bacterium]